MGDNSNRTLLSKSPLRLHYPTLKTSPRLLPSTYLASFEMFPIEHTKNIPLFQSATEYQTLTNNPSFGKKSGIISESKSMNTSSWKEPESESLGSGVQLANQLYSLSSNKNFPARRFSLHTKSARFGALHEGKLERMNVNTSNVFICDTTYALIVRNISSKSVCRNLPMIKKAKRHKGYTGFHKKCVNEIPLKPLTSQRVIGKNAGIRLF